MPLAAAAAHPGDGGAAFLHRPPRITPRLGIAAAGVHGGSGQTVLRFSPRRQARARQQARQEPPEPPRLLPPHPDRGRLRGAPAQATARAAPSQPHPRRAGRRDDVGAGEQGQEVVAVGELPSGLEVWKSSVVRFLKIQRVVPGGRAEGRKGGCRGGST